MEGFANFDHWKLFDICKLIFVISIIQGTSNKANTLRGALKPGPMGPPGSVIPLRLLLQMGRAQVNMVSSHKEA